MRKTEEYSIKLTDDNAKTKKHIRKEKIDIFEFFGILVSVLIVITLIFTCLFRVVNVNGPSMKPTLQDGDKLIITAAGYKPEKGDIVVISSDEGVKQPIVKRIIATGGDVVDINFTTGVVTVNGIEEDYTDELTSQQFDTAFPLTVPEGTVFVLGDNRANSIDSRSTQVGCVDERMIVGKVLFKLFPPGKVE